MKTDQSDLYDKLRKEYPYFIYETYSYIVENNELRINFLFRLSEEYSFQPALKLSLPESFDQNRLNDSLFRNIIFNLGMIELISYWKAACSPELIVRPQALSASQVLWWKKLYLNGLGEFFYTNGIEPGNDFMTIRATEGKQLEKSNCETAAGLLVPVGGGKDSVVSLELLSHYKNCTPFIINPRPASMHTLNKAGFSEGDSVRLFRSIDPILLELNDKGFLNGHTPFSAMLAFASTLVAFIYGIPEIALSNESSANEPSIPGTAINHQYSKSIEFETDFREYVQRYITDDIRYFSFLRPLNELQIAKIFAGFHNHFDTFRSCNVGSKTDSWCGKCPKCLFTFIILSPFVEHAKLVRIFARDLFEDETLIPLLDQLTGIAEEKPFECIGTLDEVNAALKHSLEKFPIDKLPPLLQHYRDHAEADKGLSGNFESLLHEFSDHYLPGEAYVQLLKNALND
jgi:hypothetical protein